MKLINGCLLIVTMTGLFLGGGCTSAAYKRTLYGLEDFKGRKMEIAFTAQPEGARIEDVDTQNAATLPVTVNYIIDNKASNLGYISPPNLVATWRSGATAKLEGAHFSFTNGFKQSYQFSHPDSSGRRLAYDSLSSQIAQAWVEAAPPGAQLYFNGKYVGSSPTRISGNITLDNFDGTNVILGECYAIWPSGASSTVQRIVVPSSISVGIHVTIAHPDAGGSRFAYDSLTEKYVAVEILSSPPFARIFGNGAEIGVSPTRIAGYITPDNFDGTNVNLGECYAIWPSGVTSSVTQILFQLEAEGRGPITMHRPDGAPGLEYDLDYSNRVAWMRAFDGHPPILRFVLKSDPSGATLYQDNLNHGQCPVLMEYALNYEDWRSDTVSLGGLNVRWASGATNAARPVFLTSLTNAVQEFTFIRPDNVSGRELDVSFALEQQRLALESLKRENEALELRQKAELAEKQRLHDEAVLRQQEERAERWREEDLDYRRQQLAQDAYNERVQASIAQQAVDEQRRAGQRAIWMNGMNNYLNSRQQTLNNINYNSQQMLNRQQQYQNYLQQQQLLRQQQRFESQPTRESGTITGPGGTYHYNSTTYH